MADVTNKFSAAISAFAADFELAKDKSDFEKSRFVSVIVPKSAKLTKDMELLSELECKLRYGQLKIVEAEPTEKADNNQNDKTNYTRKVVLFDEFATCCPFSASSGLVNEDYCSHDCNIESVCSAYDCPLGRNAEKEDVADKSIDWNGLCRNGNGDIYDGNQYFVLGLDGVEAEDAALALEKYEAFLNKKGKE